jgi:hypothetical protein
MSRAVSPGLDLAFLSRLTAFSLRHRLLVALVWLVVISLGIVASLRLGPLLKTGFSLPGTDSARVKQLLAQEYGVGSGAEFVLIAKSDGALHRVRLAASQAGSLLPGGRVDDVERLPSGAGRPRSSTRRRAATVRPTGQDSCARSSARASSSPATRRSSMTWRRCCRATCASASSISPCRPRS